jgi:hypothetical protein
MRVTDLKICSRRLNSTLIGRREMLIKAIQTIITTAVRVITILIVISAL